MVLYNDKLACDFAAAVDAANVSDAIDCAALDARGKVPGEGWAAWIKRAFELGVSSVAEKDLGSIDGTLDTRFDGTRVIEINTRRPRTRQLFSLAHEIGHLLIEQYVPFTRATLKERSLFHCDLDREEERLADRLAATMLMPSKSVCEVLAEFGAGLTGVCKVGERFGVSIQAAARRIIELAKSQVALLMFDYRNAADDFHFGKSVVWNLPFRSAITKPWIIRREELGMKLAVNSSQEIQFPLPVTLRDVEKYDAEARWRGRSLVLFMIHLEKVPSS